MRLKRYAKTLTLTGLVFLVAGCAAKRPDFQIQDLNPPVQSGKYVQAVDNFLIILDASDSMSGTYAGKQKFEIAREMLAHMNRTIPEINLLGGLRVCGNTPSGTETELTYGFSDYTMSRTLEDALYEISGPAGRSSLGMAIQKGTKDLKPRKGRSAVIVVSDGKVTDNPAASAKEMKAELGENVCIYSVFVGDNPKGKKVMEELALAGECGFAEKAEMLNSPTDMSGFVRKIFLKPVAGSPPAESAEEVKIVPVYAPPVSEGKEDTDGDGIENPNDACPDTPKGVQVDEKGCWVIGSVLFDYNQWRIKAEYFSTLDNVAEVMKSNPGLHVRLEGHTDNVGSAGYNMRLSEKRAEAVKSWLMKKGISARRLETIGYGFSKPAASNDTGDGRAKNRRVELDSMRVR
ncbi:MAG: OmpA family protein [Desulfobacterales bacterium]